MATPRPALPLLGAAPARSPAAGAARALACALLAAPALAGCRPSSAPEAVAPAAPSAPSATPGAPGRTGTARISGRVLFRGPVPEAREPAAPFPECSNRVPQRPLQVAAGGGLANAFVWVQGGLPPGDYPVPATPVELDQKDCEYSPRVFGIRPGQPLSIRNSDNLLHNVNARGQGAGLSRGINAFNVAMPLQGLKVTRRFEAPQVAVTITCDVHPWMRAYAGVVPHPFFSVTGADGAFAIPGLPAGRYTLEAWHERLGRATVEVEVADGGQAAATIELMP